VRILNKIEWIIALLYADNCKPIYGITKFEKLLFYYLNKFSHTNDAKMFGFEPYRFGPHSDYIRDILYALRDKKIISIQSQATDNLLALDAGDEIKPIYFDKQEIYQLTQIGKEIAEKVIQKMKNFSILNNFKEKFNPFKLDKLIRLVYTEFPMMTTKSEILNKYR